MSDDYQSLSQRMTFMRLDEAGKAAIRSLKPLVEKELPGVLDSFYARIREFPEVGHFFSEAGRAEQAKGAQLRHWARISSSDFNLEYLRSVRTIGQTHARIGLEPRWYVGGYALITEQLIAAALKHFWPKVSDGTESAKCEDVAAGLGALAKAVFLDMDIAISTYIETAEEGRRRAEEASAAAAKQQATVVEAITAGLDHLVKGDLTYRSSEQFDPAYQKVQDDFNAAIEELQQTLQAIAEATREVAAASAEISAGTTDLSERTEQQAASLEETSASMEEISATVKKNAENAQQANEFTASTRQVADRGGVVVNQAVSAMARIKESSSKISDIIGVIDEIARQTNLLALNAAVEAARAGDAGRGFAVVASEVRSLAQRSSQAAKDIKDLITNSTHQVQEGVELVNKTGASLTEILDSVKKVADIVADIATASGQQSSGIEQVNIALSQMDGATQQNSALVEENAAAAKALEQQSQAMQERVDFFQLGEAESYEPAAAAPVFERPVAKSPSRSRPVAAAGVAERPAAVPPRVSRPAPAINRPAAVPPAKRPAVAAAERSPARKMQNGHAAALKQDPEWKEF